MTAINKTEALKRLSILESETKELRKIIDAPVNITDRVKTFQDACNVLGITWDGAPSVLKQPDEVAYGQLKIIVGALNEGWTPDWNNNSEYKYYPWFKMDRGFVLNDVDYHCTDTHVGSRLCFKNEQLAEYAAKQFLSIYKAFMQ